jgi:hypothetical protein
MPAQSVRTNIQSRVQANKETGGYIPKNVTLVFAAAAVRLNIQSLMPSNATRELFPRQRDPSKLMKTKPLG